MSDYKLPAYLDEQTKRIDPPRDPHESVRSRATKCLLPAADADALWLGHGGCRCRAGILTPEDRQVIESGADDTTNAVSISGCFEKTACVARDPSHHRASCIQTVNRIPERPCRDQILVYQGCRSPNAAVPEPSEVETRKMHSLENTDYATWKLYEDITEHVRLPPPYAYPVNRALFMDPSPIPKSTTQS